jgi:hypothetical protein
MTTNKPLPSDEVRTHIIAEGIAYMRGDEGAQAAHAARKMAAVCSVPSAPMDWMERSAYAIIGLAVLAAVFFTLTGWGRDASQAADARECQEIARFYGVSSDSPAGHRMLPEGVDIEYVEGACRRTDNLTVMTGNER